MISFKLAKLANRKLLKISGPDCYPYLQGLLCNDLRFLYEPDRIPKRIHANNTPSVLSTFMLNPLGRSICDLIIYRTPLTRYECKFTPPGQAKDYDELLIECASNLASGISNTLYGYRVRRKVQLTMMDDLTIWSLFPKILDDINDKNFIKLNDATQLVHLKPLESTDIIGEDLTVVNDPRLTQLGMRIISKESNIDVLKRSLESVINSNIIKSTLKEYCLHRYLLGVGEGPKDHPESDCLPLECNADFLGSVSFDKGCYLGQELTARIHYTGVVRKRLMPIVLDLETCDLEKAPLDNGSDIVDADSKKKIGILRNVIKNRGLALLRHDMALNAKKIIHSTTNTKISTYKPYWWDLIIN